MSATLIEQAATSDYQVTAMGAVMKALSIQHAYCADRMPGLREWKRMDIVQRQIALAEWLKSEIYAHADFETTKVQFTQVGGAAYAHQND